LELIEQLHFQGRLIGIGVASPSLDIPHRQRFFVHCYTVAGGARISSCTISPFSRYRV
jgi:hypothetical protein